MPVPATLYLSESNGAGPTVTNQISNLNFGGADLPNVVPANHPVIKPGGTNARFNSYWKSLRPRVFSLGDSIQIQDFRIWKSAGVYLSEEVILLLNIGTNVYGQPAQTNMAGSQIFNADPGAATMNTHPGDLLPITAADGIPYYAPYFQLQWVGNDVAAGTTPIGSVNQKTIVFTYDES